MEQDILKEILNELQIIRAVLLYMVPDKKESLELENGKRFIDRRTLEDALKSRNTDPRIR